MPWEPEPATAIRIVWIAAALMFLLAIVSAIGEWRGWWGFLGELGMIVGTLGGVLLAAYGFVSSAGRGQLTSVGHQVDAVHEAVVENGVRLGSVDGKLDELAKLDKLDGIQGALDEQTGVLAQIRDGL